MVDIPEYIRDETKDYLAVLRSLNEIPFPVGKKLLVDFLIGDMDNKSILKNNLYDRHNFGSLQHLDSGKISLILESVIINRFVDLSPSIFNKFIKVLSLNIAGQKELIEPTLNSKKVSNKYEEVETKITDREMREFKELADFLKDFNMEQKKAIVNLSSKILVLAGAGSGKTTVLTKRIEFLNKYQKVKDEKILAITFTRKAKEEMQERLSKLGVNANVQTFNSFSERLLLKYGFKIYGRKMKVMGFPDKMVSVVRALDHMGIDMGIATDRYFSMAQKRYKNPYQLQNIFVNDVYSVFEYFRLKGKSFDELLENYSGKDYSNAKMIFEIVKFLDKFIQNSGFRTYTDQVNDILKFFKLHPKFIPEYEHVLVDEFQDVNSEQVELIDLLNSKNLFCVGDPRQSIFGWRGSCVDYILDFHNKYVESVVINLKKNYRSNGHVVEFMNNSIREMKMPDLEAVNDGEKHMKLISFGDELGEFNFIRAKILNSELPREEIFVVARTNRQLIELSEVLKRDGIKHILKNDEGANGVKAKVGEVTLATIHSIKGLEAELVFVIGCTPSNFPCKTSDHPVIENIKMYEYDREEEERRLFYVAISRAKSKLYLTYSGKKCSYFLSKDLLKLLEVEEF